MKTTKSAEKAKKLGKPTFVYECAECGEEFETAQLDAKYCCELCKKTANSRASRERYYQRKYNTTPPQQCTAYEIKERNQDTNQNDDFNCPQPRKYDKNRMTFVNRCSVCGQEYKTNFRHSIYCSVTCQQRKWREDKEAERTKTEKEISDLRSDVEHYKYYYELALARLKFKKYGCSYDSISARLCLDSGRKDTPIEEELNKANEKISKLKKELAELKKELKKN